MTATKIYPLSFRMTAEMRVWLEDRSKKNGRSLAAEVETILMEQRKEAFGVATR